MNALLFSDLHASVTMLEKIGQVVANDLSENSPIVFAGDLGNMGEPLAFADRFIDWITLIKNPFLWVPGNNDFGPIYHTLYEAIPSLEGRVEQLFGRSFSGVGGSPASWSAATYQGKKTVKKEEIAGSIFVSHYPPPGVFNYVKLEEELSPSPFDFEQNQMGNLKSKILNPKQNPNNQNTRSQNVLNFENLNLEFISDLGIRDSNLPTVKRLANSPMIHICGHWHTQVGLAYLGTTKIVKLGAADLGHYGIIDLKTLKVTFHKVN